MTYLAQEILEERMVYGVEQTMSSRALIVTCLADSEMDFFLDAWSPSK